MRFAAFVLGAMLIPIGAWTVVHPNGGYRAAGGAGSGLTSGTRRMAGVALVVAGLLVLVLAANG